MLLSLLAYTVVQVFSLTTGLGVLACIFFLIMYFIYFRFDEKTGYTMILVPLLCMLRLPILIPLILAVVGTSGSVVGCLLGVFSYYFLNYLRMHTAVFQGLTDNSEITKMSMAVNGVFSYKEMWYTLVCVAIVFFITFFLKKINVNQSNLVAISIGAGSYLILILVSNLIFGAISTYKILWLVLGSVISCILAMLITSAILPLDYSRTEIMEFEDDEYKYYVRAVPKVSVSRESVKIKRIYSRKRHDTARGKENEQ